MPDFRDDDITRLRRCLEWEPPDQEVERPWLGAFQRMLIDLEAGTWYELTEKQRAWVERVFEEVTGEPIYRNLVSGGQIPRGKYGATQTPAVLQAPLPKRPPGRR